MLHKKPPIKISGLKKKQIGIWLAILTCKTKVKKNLNSAWFYHFECY